MYQNGAQNDPKMIITNDKNRARTIILRMIPKL